MCSHLGPALIFSLPPADPGDALAHRRPEGLLSLHTPWVELPEPQLQREQDPVQGWLVSSNPARNKQMQVEKGEKPTDYLMLPWCPNVSPGLN